MFPKRYFNTLFGKLFTGFCAVILLTAASVWMAAYLTQIQQNEDIGRIEWRFIARKSVDSAIGIYEFGGREALTSWLNNPRLNTNPSVYLVNEQGQEFSGRKVPDKATGMLTTLRHNPDTSFDRGTKAYVRSIEIDEQTWHIFAVRTQPFPIRLIPSNIYHFPVGLTLSLAAFFTLLVSWLLARLYTRSLNQLDKAMRHFAQGDFNTRAPTELTSANTEVSNLATVFDSMADRIQALINRQQRLFHDVSHEIRSPLARIDVALDLIRQDPKRTPKALDRIQQEVNNIDSLVESLLTYARLDNLQSLNVSVIGLADVVNSIADDLQFEAQNSQVSVVASVQGDPIINADGDLLIRALDNIARNALRHSPKGGTITLSLSENATHFIFQCQDQGTGIPEEELTNIFSPFVRGSNEATGSGFGLGLSIAKRSIVAHGGNIIAENVKPHGLNIRVTLPKSIAIKSP